MQAQSGKCLDLRIWNDSIIVTVTAELPPDDFGRSQRPNCFEQPDLFVSHRFRVPTHGGVHRQQHQDLEHMVLYHIANRTDFFIETPAPLHAEVLGHCDLHARNVVAVPDGFEKRVGKPKIEKILDWFLSQKMVDAENGRLGKRLMKSPVQQLCRRQISAKWFFNDHSRVIRRTGFSEPVDNDAKHAWGNRQIMQWPLSAAKRAAQALIRRWVLVISVDVLKPRRQFRKGIGIQTAVLLKAVASTLFQ